MKKLLLVFAALFLFSCVQNEEPEIRRDSSGILNSNGQAFMEVIKNSPVWKSDWGKLSEVGTPLPNEVTVMMVFPGKSYYVIPLVNGKEIEGFGFYAFEQNGNEGGEQTFQISSPEIVSKNESDDNPLIQKFLKTQSFKELLNKGFATSIRAVLETTRAGDNTWRVMTHDFECVISYRYASQQEAGKIEECIYLCIQMLSFFHYEHMTSVIDRPYTGIRLVTATEDGTKTYGSDHEKAADAHLETLRRRLNSIDGVYDVYIDYTKCEGIKDEDLGIDISDLPPDPPSYDEKLKANADKLKNAFGDKIKNILAKTTIVISFNIPADAMAMTVVNPSNIYDPDATLPSIFLQA